MSIPAGELTLAGRAAHFCDVFAHPCTESSTSYLEGQADTAWACRAWPAHTTDFRLDQHRQQRDLGRELLFAPSDEHVLPAS